MTKKAFLLRRQKAFLQAPARRRRRRAPPPLLLLLRMIGQSLDQRPIGRAWREARPRQRRASGALPPRRRRLRARLLLLLPLQRLLLHLVLRLLHRPRAAL